MPHSKRCACYIRVSTENQIENYSIDEQIDRLKSYCRAKDINNINFYTDGGYSGGNLNRPALLNMLTDIENGLIDLVIVYKLDRLSRSQKDTLMLIEDKFLASNVDFISMSENFDTTTPYGRAMIGILSVFAQLEKDQITERFTMGRIGRAKNGLFHGGAYIPTGYDYVDGQLVVNEYEALQVREVFDRFLKGQSIHSIWKYMQKNYTTKYGTWSSDTLVRSVLNNSIYIGKVKFKGQEYEGKHLPIVANDTFDLARNLLSSKDRHSNLTSFQLSPFKANNLLTNMIYCKKCGARFCGEHGNYTCYSRSKTDKRQIRDPNCRNKKWKISELDNLIYDQIESMKFEKIQKNPTQVISVNNDTVYHRISEIDKQMSRMLDLYQIGTLPIDQIQTRINNLTTEKKSLNESMKQFGDSGNSLGDDAISIKDKLHNLRITGSIDEKRLLIRMLIDYIEIDEEVVELHLKI